MPLAGELVQRIVSRVRAVHPDCLVSCEILDKWFTDRADNTYTTETGRRFSSLIWSPRSGCSCLKPVTKLMLLGPVPMIDAIAGLVSAEFAQVAVIRSDPELVQITDLSVSKALGLRHVAEFYGVPMSRVLAIGDALNDVEMLRAAGIAVAVGNAHPQVKKVAHWIAPSNNRAWRLRGAAAVRPGRPQVIFGRPSRSTC